MVLRFIRSPVKTKIFVFVLFVFQVELWIRRVVFIFEIYNFLVDDQKIILVYTLASPNHGWVTYNKRLCFRCLFCGDIYSWCCWQFIGDLHFQVSKQTGYRTNGTDYIIPSHLGFDYKYLQSVIVYILAFDCFWAMVFWLFLLHLVSIHYNSLGDHILRIHTADHHWALSSLNKSLRR